MRFSRRQIIEGVVGALAISAAVAWPISRHHTATTPAQALSISTTANPGFLSPDDVPDAVAAALADSDTRTPGGQIPIVAIKTDATGRPSFVGHDVDTEAEAVAAVQADAAAGDVTAVGVGQNVSLSDAPTTPEPRQGEQWAYLKTTFPAAWTISTGKGVTAAVIDSGVYGDHEDIGSKMVTGHEFTSGTGGSGTDGGTTDQNSHGSHVAGIIAAATNGAGIVGGAPDAAIMPVKVMQPNGGITGTDVAAAVVWAVDHGARVLNLSLGTTGNDKSIQTALAYATAHGAVSVVAMGNAATTGNPITYPAAYADSNRGIIAVGATDQTNARASFSNHRTYISVAAPGTNILSLSNTDPQGYVIKQGTSMATPLVAGEVALILSAHPTATPAQVRAVVEASAKDLGVKGKDENFGFGLIDPNAALALDPTAAPAPPAKIGATAIKTNSFTVAWTAGTGGGLLDSFTVKINGVVKASGLAKTTASYAASAVTPAGSTVVVTIVAVGPGGESPSEDFPVVLTPLPTTTVKATTTTVKPTTTTRAPTTTAKPADTTTVKATTTTAKPATTTTTVKPTTTTAAQNLPVPMLTAASAPSSGGIQLAGTAGPGVTKVRVLRAGALVGTATVANGSWTLTDSAVVVAAGRSYSYTLQGLDDSGATSPVSATYVLHS